MFYSIDLLDLLVLLTIVVNLYLLNVYWLQSLCFKTVFHNLSNLPKKPMNKIPLWSHFNDEEMEVYKDWVPIAGGQVHSKDSSALVFDSAARVF